MNFLKGFGLGILWILLLPFLLVAIAIVMCFGAVNFIVQFFIMIVHFFQGKTLFPPFEEDLEAQKILKREIDRINGEEDARNAPPQQPNVYVQQNYYQTPPPGMPQQGYPQAPYQQPGYPQAPYQQPSGNIGQAPYQQGQLPPGQQQPPYQNVGYQPPYQQPQQPQYSQIPTQDEVPPVLDEEEGEDR